MADPTYPLFSVFAFLGFIVALIPLPWHFQAWNAGTCIFMLWASISSLIQFVNSLVWRGNVADVAPIWCDICKSSQQFSLNSRVLTNCSSIFISYKNYHWCRSRNPRCFSLYQSSTLQDRKYKGRMLHLARCKKAFFHDLVLANLFFRNAMESSSTLPLPLDYLSLL